jgi:hypothetical protein
MAAIMLILFQHLNFISLHERRNQLDKSFVSFFWGGGSKCCPSSTDIIGLRFTIRNLRDFPLFQVRPSFKNLPSTRCAAAANSVRSYVYVFRRQILALIQILYYYFFLTLGVLVYYLDYFVFVSCVSCILSFVVSVFCAVSVIDHIEADSARQ